MPIATVAGGEPRRTVDNDIGKWRLDAHLDRIPREIGRKDKAHALEVDGERVRADVVGSQRLAVERRRIVSSDVEPSPVQHQVATDGREAGGAKAGDELAELLEGDFRIAAAFEHQIAAEHAGDDRTVGIGFGLPAIVRPEELEAGKRRHQLHGRRRIHRLRWPVYEQRFD